MSSLRSSSLSVIVVLGLAACGGGDSGGSRDAGADADAADEDGGDAGDGGEEAGPPLECEAPVLDCNGIRRDGCEADTRTSSDNCGECGNRCSAPGSVARCQQSACTFTCMAGHDDCNDDESDGCEASLSMPSSCGACDRACPTSPPSVCIDSAYCRHQLDTGSVDDIFLDAAGDNVYYVNGEVSVRVYDLTARSWDELHHADNEVLLGSAFVYDGAVWFVNRTSEELYTMPLTGGTPTAHAAVDGTLSHPVVIGTQVVMVSDAGELYRIRLDVSQAPVLITTGSSPTPPVADGTAVLWNNGGALERQPISGAAATNLADDLARSVALVGSVVWYTTVEGTIGSVRSVPRTGGTVDTVQDDLGAVRALAVNAQSIYVFEDAGGSGKLLRIPRAGGDPEQIDSVTNVHEIAVTNTEVIWASDSAGLGSTEL